MRLAYCHTSFVFLNVLVPTVGGLPPFGDEVPRRRTLGTAKSSHCIVTEPRTAALSTTDRQQLLWTAKLTLLYK